MPRSESDPDVVPGDAKWLAIIVLTLTFATIGFMLWHGIGVWGSPTETVVTLLVLGGWVAIFGLALHKRRYVWTAVVVVAGVALDAVATYVMGFREVMLFSELLPTWLSVSAVLLMVYAADRLAERFPLGPRSKGQPRRRG